MGLLREIGDLILRLFAFGLFITIIMDWVMSQPPTGFRKAIKDFYRPFLAPIQRYVKPIKISPNAPVGLDISPLVLLMLVWWVIHPFLMWILGA